MATNSNSWTHERAKIASLSKTRPDDDPDLLAHRQRLKGMRLEDHVRAAVESFPPITDEQAERVAALLWPTGGVGK
ncbi:hypothetical protein [Arthrobacter oryzae]|uniref:hypothetical protein n=1 Tax=Arthrobacter oryzae TaxID=409290 RepID=UPI0030C94487